MCKREFTESQSMMQAHEATTATALKAPATFETATAVEAPCPACGALVCYAGSARRVWCPACGWDVTLYPDEARDFTNALIGLDPTLRLDLFLQIAAGVSRDTPLPRLTDWYLGAALRWSAVQLTLARGALLALFIAVWMRRYCRAMWRQVQPRPRLVLEALVVWPILWWLLHLWMGR
jgi:predicted RNA-binding Zn-ribbon protein involved in translation (DUF1610 family)